MKNRLFEPINIGAVTVPNRLVMPGMFTAYGDTSGYVTQRQIDYYAERAKNNVGLVIIEATPVAIGGRLSEHNLGLHDDSFIPGLSKLAAGVKAAGARCFLLMNHCGRKAPSKFNGGRQPVAPSPIPSIGYEMPRELTIEEIDRIIEAFGQGARRAKEARFDGVEVLFAHGYIVSGFLSPLTNKRTDAYGGNFESRVRFPLEIVQRIRQRTGENYPIIARVCGDEYIKGGWTLRDSQRFAPMLQEAGVNAINVSAGFYSSHEEGHLSARFPGSVAPMGTPRGEFVHMAEAIKKTVKVPVIAVGRLDDPELAESVIANGQADMVAIGRGVIADPAFVAKLYQKQTADIRRCIACCECLTTCYEGNMKCTVNPEVGIERDYQLSPAAKPKRVLVVGGGPGGMEAALVAALRGHKVTLVEKKPYLGGNMIAAAAVSFKRDISLFTDYLTNAVRKSGVEISLNTEVDRANVLALKPDAVILATGALPLMPAIPGIKGSNVIHAIKVLGEKAKTGARVVVAGAGAVGCETAVFLAQQGKEVSIVEMRTTDFSATEGLAPDMNNRLRRWFLFDLWPTLPIEVIGKSTFKEINAEGLVVENREGKRRLVRGDTVVIAAGLKPNNILKPEIDGKVAELYEIGDCVKPCHIRDAVSDAARIARII